MNLYLVTDPGDLHEHHIPVGFYDFATLKNKFNPQSIVEAKYVEEREIADGNWHELVYETYEGWLSIQVILVSPNKDIPRT